MDRRKIELSQKISNRRLREDNFHLKRNLRHLVQLAKRNMQVQEKLDEVGQLVLKCDDLESLALKVTDAIMTDFGVTAATFCLEERYRGMMPETAPGDTPLVLDKVFFMDRERIEQVFAGDTEPVLKSNIEHGDVDMFGMKVYRRVRSQAFVPLFYGEEYLGSLNLGSNEPFRYSETQAGDILKRFGQIISLALVNLELRESASPSDMGEMAAG